MEDYRLGVVESKFAGLIWANEPLSSRALVELCQRELNWKKSTTYTVLRKLCARGIFQNTDGMVTSLISREDFYALQAEKVVTETFSGSLPAFFAAFTKRRELTAQDLADIRRMIDEYGEE